MQFFILFFIVTSLPNVLSIHPMALAKTITKNEGAPKLLQKENARQKKAKSLNGIVSSLQVDAEKTKKNAALVQKKVASLNGILSLLSEPKHHDTKSTKNNNSHKKSQSKSQHKSQHKSSGLAGILAILPLLLKGLGGH